jgi:glycosyltransferase involved in cell wall biosynthesis
MAKLTGRVSILDFIDIMYSNWALKNASRILSYFTKFQIPAFIPREKIDIVYMTVDERTFNPNIDTSELRKKLGLAENSVVGLYVGGFYKWHGLEYLVKAVNIIKQNPNLLPPNKNLIIILVGSGDEFNNIKDLIKKHQLESYFLLTGKVDFSEVPKYTCLADFCCSLNSADAIGFKLVEYMACGKPTLIGALDIVPKFFHNNETVIYTDSTNPEDIAQKIIYIMKNLEKAKIIGQNARKLVETKYTWTQHGKTIINAIHKSLKR